MRRIPESLLLRFCFRIQRSRDKWFVLRMRAVRAALELRMELHANEERMVGQFRRLNDASVR